jgi:predicted nucleic acid-binding Zn ribbon protein
MTGACAVSDDPSGRDEKGGNAGKAGGAPPAEATQRDDPVTQLYTGNGGKDDHPVDRHADITPVDRDIAQSALAEAQTMAKRRQKRRRVRRENLLGRSPGGYSGPKPDESDPQPIGGLIPAYVDELGWQRPLAEAKVFAEWPRLVGSDVASHCEPSTLRDGELRVTAESTAWATQLRLLAGTMLARLVGELGPEAVTKLVITGPTGPSWKHGGYSVRGARGPRDTYG